MIKISPFTPLFFSPSTDAYGVESRYMQVFAPGDAIVIQVLADGGESVSGRMVNAVSGLSQSVDFVPYEMASSVVVYTAVVSGLSEGYYTAIVADKESDVFHITSDESELAGTSLIKYTSNTNRHRSDVVFVTDTKYEFQFRVPGGFKDNDWSFEVSNEQFDTGDGNIVELYAVESTQKTFTMGNSMGCPIWFGEHLNRLLCSTHVHINDVRYVRKGNSTPEVIQEVQNQKSYIFRVQLQGMVENVDIDLPSSSGEESESEGGGAGYVYLIKVGDSTRATDSNTFSALRVLVEVQRLIDENRGKLDGQYLRKDEDDTAAGLITFMKGLVAKSLIKAENGIAVTGGLLEALGATFGPTIDSMLAGKGTLITSDGRVQTDRMEVRGSAIFREIVYNRLNAQEGDSPFSENGLVEEVTLESDGTYTLKLQKRWDGDFTAFQEGDILYGDVNNLFASGEYYTSWVWVLSVNPTANTVSVVMYGDKEVPGGVNHAPEPLMRVVKRGNAIDTTRQSYWYLSATTEKCFIWLEGVDKPMLAENNYYIMIGRPKNLSIFDNLPINYEHSYIYARGAIIQDLFRVDFQGVQVKTETPRGFWAIEVAQSDNPYLNTDDTYHTVSHYGCEWKCLVSGTLQEPKYGASDWAMLRGNPEFTIDIDSTRGWFFDVETFSTTLFITGRLYNQDVTDSILDGDCSWTRDTGNVAEDNAWAVKRADAGKSIDLTLDDLGPNYPMLTGCKFKCTALLRDGQQVEIAENYVTF